MSLSHTTKEIILSGFIFGSGAGILLTGINMCLTGHHGPIDVVILLLSMMISYPLMAYGFTVLHAIVSPRNRN